MDLLFTLLFSFALLVFSALNQVPILYPLLITLAVLMGVLRQRGFAWRHLMQMGLSGSRQAFPVINILLLIGGVTAVWMAAGTVPAIVYYGLQLIHPAWFIVAAFALTSLVSLLIGTSFGAASTIGLALMIMARGSSVDPHLIAGAVIAGAYFGDRCSPMSSSAHLVATITQTNLYDNLRGMMLTSIGPLLASGGIYLLLSRLYPVQITQTTLPSELTQLFDLNWMVFLPALVLIGLAIVQFNVKGAMLVSLAIGVAVALGVQHQSLGNMLRYAVVGFQVEQDTPVRSILLGGGLLSMAKVCLVVLVSTAIAGILSGTKALQTIETIVKTADSRSHLFLGTTLIGIASAAFGCTQTIAILLTQQLVKTKYADERLPNSDLAIDLENTVIVLSPLIPWNIAGLVPATVLMTDAGFIPYAVYLYLLPIGNWLWLKWQDSRQGRYEG